MIQIRLVLTAVSLVALHAVVPRPSHAQSFITGSQLAIACASRAVADERSCSGYIAGALDEVVGSAELKATICPPANTKLGALREAVAKFGKDKPDEAKGSGVALLHAMLKANYPCAK